MDNIDNELYQLLGTEAIRRSESMSKHTTFRIGGLADYLVMPDTADQIAKTISWCQRHELPYYVLGNGSNLLVSDKGYRGVVISIHKQWSKVVWEGCCVTAQAGVSLAAIARQAQERQLSGMEGLAGIPGTLGGAVVMNAGAYGFELKDILIGVTVLTVDGQLLDLMADELALGYRSSCIPSRNYIVLEVRLQLNSGNGDEIRTQMEAFAEQRRDKQPLEYPSAGSTFKRPAGYFAGKLIEDAGLKGYQVGGAQVSEKHSGFVINRGNATAADVWQLCHDVQAKVEEQFHVNLEMEVKLLGEF